MTTLPLDYPYFDKPAGCPVPDGAWPSAWVGFALGAILAGCQGPDVRPFLGAWRLGGTVSVVLGSGRTRRSLSRSGPTVPNYEIVFTRGTTSALVSQDSERCVFLWDLAGATAAIEPAQRCTAIGGRKSTRTLELTSRTIAVSVVDGTHLSAKGDVEGTVGERGVLFGVTEKASAHPDGTLTSAAAAEAH